MATQVFADEELERLRGFPEKWRGYLETARKAGNTSAYRHYWELCTLLALRDGLRSGDVYVPGSRRYSDPAEFGRRSAKVVEIVVGHARRVRSGRHQ